MVIVLNAVFTMINMGPIPSTLKHGPCSNGRRVHVPHLHIQSFECSLQFDVLCRLVNGQDLEYDSSIRSGGPVEWHPSVFHGLFGGYMFYDHCVNMRLPPLADAVERTVALRQRVSGGLSCRDKGWRGGGCMFTMQVHWHMKLLLSRPWRCARG